MTWFPGAEDFGGTPPPTTDDLPDGFEWWNPDATPPSGTTWDDITGLSSPDSTSDPTFDGDGLGSPSSPSVASMGAGAAVATIDGRTDKPRALSRWYATVQSVTAGIATVELQDDSDGDSVISVPVESATPATDDRVIVDFRADGLAVVSAIVNT